MMCINKLTIYKIGGDANLDNDKKLIIQTPWNYKRTMVEIVFPGFDKIEVSANELLKSIKNCINSE